MQLYIYFIIIDIVVGLFNTLGGGIMFHLNNKRKGSALVMVLIIMLVLSILGTAIMRVAVAENNFAKRNEDRLQAYYIARSGAQAIAEYMIKDNYNDADAFIGKESEPNSQVGGGEFKVSVSKDPSNGEVSVTSIGDYNGVKQEARLIMTSSPSGQGGIFQYAIAAKSGITTDNNAGEGVKIVGPVATRDGDIFLGSNSTKPEEEIVKDPNLIFPPIVPPPEKSPPFNYDLILGKITSSPSTITSSNVKPLYIKTEDITGNNIKIKVTGNGVVHMYVHGDIELGGGNSSFDVDITAKVYIYVIPTKPNPQVVFRGAGNQNNIFLYAPDSEVIWNNAGAGDFFGSVIGNTVTLHNHSLIEHNPEMEDEVDLDDTNIGIKYTGYKWID